MDKYIGSTQKYECRTSGVDFTNEHIHGQSDVTKQMLKSEKNMNIKEEGRLQIHGEFWLTKHILKDFNFWMSVILRIF